MCVRVLHVCIVCHMIESTLLICNSQLYGICVRCNNKIVFPHTRLHAMEMSFQNVCQFTSGDAQFLI